MATTSQPKTTKPWRSRAWWLGLTAIVVAVAVAVILVLANAGGTGGGGGYWASRSSDV